MKKPRFQMERELEIIEALKSAKTLKGNYSSRNFPKTKLITVYSALTLISIERHP